VNLYSNVTSAILLALQARKINQGLAGPGSGLATTAGPVARLGVGGRYLKLKHAIHSRCGSDSPATSAIARCERMELWQLSSDGTRRMLSLAVEAARLDEDRVIADAAAAVLAAGRPITGARRNSQLAGGARVPPPLPKRVRSLTAEQRRQLLEKLRKS